MATVTVPGAGQTIVSQTYNSAGNTALAQAIQAQLVGLGVALNTQNYAGASTPAPLSGGANELVIPPGSDGQVVVPPGWQYVVDNSSGVPLDVSNGQSFLGGDENITYANIAGSGVDTITVGDGNNLLNLVAGSQYAAAVGSGADSIVAAGHGVLAGGDGGTDLFLIPGGSDTINAGSGAVDEVAGGTGSVFFVGGSGNVESLVGGTGGDTVVGGPSSVVIYGSPVAAAPGALLVAGGGNETLFGAGSKTNDLIYGDQHTGGNDLLVGGAGANAMVAGTGNDTLWAASTNNVFYFVQGQAGGNDVIAPFAGHDIVALIGYDSAAGAAPGTAAQAAIRGATVTGAGVQVALADGTTITFSGLTSAQQLNGHIVSS